MNAEIIVSIISLIGTIITVWSGNRLTAYRIEQLEKKVKEHNNLIKRTYELEKKLEIDEVRISDLEEKK